MTPIPACYIAVLCRGFAICYRHPQGVDMFGLWHGSALFQGIRVVWTKIWRKSLWNPHKPRSMDSLFFSLQKAVVFRFCWSLLVLIPIQWRPYFVIHDVYPNLSKQAQVTTFWRLAGLNVLCSGTLILLSLHVSIDMSHLPFLNFLDMLSNNDQYRYVYNTVSSYCI